MILKKAISIILFAAVCSSFAGCEKTQKAEPVEVSLLDTKAAPQDIKLDWQEAYEKKLKEFKSSESFKDTSRFDIIDLTGDDIPELIISPSDDVSAQCEIYRLFNGGLDQIGITGSYGTFDFIPSMNAIGYSYEGDGFNIGEYLVYEEGTFNSAVSFYTNANSASAGVTIQYEVNNENVTLVKFEEILQPYRDADSFKTGRKYSFGDGAIDYAVHYSETWDQVLTDQQKQLFKERVEAVMETNDFIEAAFELVDLDLNGIPEVVVSTGMLNDSVTRILYLDEEGVKELETSCDADGGIMFDISSKIFYAADFYGSVQCWSLAGADISNFTVSDSTMRCGRKFSLNKETIEKVFANEVKNG
ncbi:MAG: hypothetical protein K6G33_12335 [Ruminococcus sp.]|uniref:hypothetical protein n=1 Tax=Ruminococcus sp. TaxID=41978 RepID=UPI0025D422D6|nr:hypothetical protein [Ruminococcus sp.]MCR5601516.1 hypothetical protein [Ruminococcus sp.]